MQAQNYEIRCFHCSAEAGQIIDGKLVRRPSVTGQIERRGGSYRCFNCGGPLYLEAMQDLPPTSIRAEIAQAFGRSAA